MSTPTPSPVAWITSAEDRSTQAYIRMSKDIATTIEVLRKKDFSEFDLTTLHAHTQQLRNYLPSPTALTTWVLDALVDARLAKDSPRLRSERDDARKECDEYMAAEGRLQQKLADAEVVINRLARTPGPGSTSTHGQERAEKIADPKEFDGTRERLKAFKDQLILKTSGNPARFPNTQHKLRYAYQFLTGKAQRTMRVHLRQTAGEDGEETYEVLFSSFAAFLATLDRHFGDPDERNTAALKLDKLRQGGREFGSYYADFQELMDILDNTDDTTRRHALKRGLSHEMLNALAIYPAPKDEAFDAYVERLNELDCRLRALRVQAPNHQHHAGCRHGLQQGSSSAPR